MKRREFGNIRTLSSGRFQARYADVSGRPHARTFPTRREASTYLASVQTDVSRGSWHDPDAARVRFDEYAVAWLDARVDLKPTTQELYRWLLTKHLIPALGRIPLEDITPVRVRTWYAALARRGAPSTTRQCYALLRTILNTAVDDEVLLRNPVRIRGAGVGRYEERPVATIAQVDALAEAVFPRYRALVLAAAWTGARWGELIALTRDRLDLLHGVMVIDRQYVLLRGQGLQISTPKTAAGVRRVHIPPHLLPVLRRHVEEFVPADCGLIFPNTLGGPLNRSSFETVWRRARVKAGMPTFRFHDLRHTGNTLAAMTGASTRELMARMGHASMRAALLYQHATDDRDQAIAEKLSELLEDTRRRESEIPDISSTG